MKVAWDASEVIRAMFAEAEKAKGRKVLRTEIAERAGMKQSEVSAYANGKLLGPTVADRLALAFSEFGVKRARKRLVPVVPSRPSRVERRLAELAAKVQGIEDDREHRAGQIATTLEDLERRLDALERGLQARPAAPSSEA